MALTPGSVIFLGKVTSKIGVQEPMTGGDSTVIANRYAIHFETTESFQAAGSPGQEIVAYTGQGGGRLFTSICSGTSPEAKVGGILRELRAIRDGERADDLFGAIGIAPGGVGFEDLAETRPLPNVSVHASSSEGEVFSAKTDEHGVFAFARPPRDTYRINRRAPHASNSVTQQQVNADLQPETGARVKWG